MPPLGENEYGAVTIRINVFVHLLWKELSIELTS
jgi:hypothetical protein